MTSQIVLPSWYEPDNPATCIAVACDFATLAEFKQFIDQCPDIKFVKIGLELFCADGLAAIEYALEAGKLVFLDLKLNDIPKTMRAAAAALMGNHGIIVLNCMAGSGVEGMRGVAEICRAHDAMSVAVTVLTSMSPEESMRIYGRSPEKQVGEVFAPMAEEAGVDTILCSPLEVPAANRLPYWRHRIKITPGIRPVWAKPDGQGRYTAPGEARFLGSSIQVIGSPITSDKYASVGTPNERYLIIGEEWEGAAA